MTRPAFCTPYAPHVLALAHTSPPSACHCEPVRTLVRQSVSPQRKERISGTLGEFVPPCGFALSVTFRFALPQENGLPRRGAAAPLLAMTCRNLPGVCVCQGALPGYCRKASLQPQQRLFLLHVIANQCAHWCGNPFPRRETWQAGTTSGKSVCTFPYSP